MRHLKTMGLMSNKTMCAIAKTVGWINVAKQHERASWLESEMCQGKARSIERVEKLCGIYVGSVFVNFMNAHKNGLLSWKGVEDHLIELIYGIIFRRKDGAFKEKGVKLMAMMDS